MLQLVILCWPFLCHFAFFFHLMSWYVFAFLCLFLLYAFLCCSPAICSTSSTPHQSKPHIQIIPFALQLALTCSHMRTHTHAQRVRWWLTWVWLCAMFSWQASVWRGLPVVLRPTNPFQSPSHHLVLSSPLLSLQAMQSPVLIIRNRPQFDAQDG